MPTDIDTGHGAVLEPRVGWRRLRSDAGVRPRRGLTAARTELARPAAWVALATIVGCTALVVYEAAAGPSSLVSHSLQSFPGWESGPLHGLGGRLTTDPRVVNAGLSIALGLMAIAWGVLATTARSLPTRVVVGAVLVLHALLLLCPPLELTDVFNYLGYARLGAVHGFNPYTHGIAKESLDPIYVFTSWHGLRSPYGQAFTGLSYLLGPLPLPVAYWLLKAVTVALSLAFVGLVASCARRLGRDPVTAVAFVALNPIFLVYAVGGFHNDVFMLVPSLAAVRLALGGRDRSAGACLALAVAVKFTAVLLGPFLLVAVATRVRIVRVLAGAVAAAVPLVAASVLLFGLSLPNLDQQSTLLTNSSIPNLIAWSTGLGGADRTVILLAELAVACVVIVIVVRLVRRRSGDWLAGAGWSTVALILSLSWVVPWYVVWVLPLAALSLSPALRRVTVLLTVFLLLAFVPVTPGFLSSHHIDPLHTPAGHESRLLQSRLAG